MRLAPRGPEGAALHSAGAPDIAYNSRHDEFLVVWSDREARSDSQRIYGRRLDGRGQPIGPVEQLSFDSATSSDANSFQPAVAYDPHRDRYAVAYQWDGAWTPAMVVYRLVSRDAKPVGTVAHVDTALTLQRNPDIAYNARKQRFLVVWDDTVRVPDAQSPRIVGVEVDARVTPSSPNMAPAWHSPMFEPIMLADGCGPGTCGASAPAVASLREDGTYIVVWKQGPQPDGPGGVWGRPIASGNLDPTTKAAPLAGRHARSPAIAVRGGRALLAHTETGSGGIHEVHATPIDLESPAPVAGEARRLNAGPAVRAVGAAEAAVAAHPARPIFLVTWNGTDDGTKAAPRDEREVIGQIVDADGRELGTDDFAISEMGFAGSGLAGTGDFPPAIAANPGTGEWVLAWAAEDDRPPLGRGEFEVFGRRVGPNPDHDYDGSPVPVDCDDGDPGVRPGGVEVPANGVDDDCSGGDDPDRDGDGVAPPRDCDDANPFVRPGRRDAPGNGVDEDCAGGDRLVRTTARVLAAWLFGTTSTTAARLVVDDVRRGVTVTVRCRGAGCPPGLRGRGRVTRVRRHGKLALTHLLADSALRPGAAVDVRVADRRAIGIVERFTARRGAPPRQSTRCLMPRRRVPVRCR